MTKFLFKFKKPNFWPIFPIFGSKKVFPSNRVITTSYRFLTPSKTQRNLMTQFEQNNQTDIKRQGWTDPIS